MNPFSNLKKFGALLVGSFLFSGVVLAQSSSLVTLKKLLASGQEEQAFQYAEKMYPEEAGDTDFDLTYGMLATRVGKYGRALFAFERLLAMNPNDQRVQLEIARLHFLEKEYEKAKVLFNKVLAQHPPKKVVDNIQHYLAEMDKQQKAADRWNRYFVKVESGYDSNINSASTSNFVNVPVIGQVQLSTDALQIHDQFIQYSTGFNGNKSFIADQNVFWAMDISRRVNPSHQYFNSDTFNAALGYAWQLGPYSVTVPVRYQQRNLENHPFQRSSAWGLELGRMFGATRKALAYFEGATTLYPTQRILDKFNYLAALSWIQVSPALGLRVQPTLLYITSDARDSDVKYNGNKLYGAMLKVNKQLTERNSLELTTGYQRSWYDRQNPLFQRRRRDNIYNSGAKWRWQARPDTAVDFSYAYYANNSNLNLYRYDRQVSGVSVEYWF